MDQVKSQNVSQGKPQDVKTPTASEYVESYQRRWEQLMQDTNRQIEKIRGTIAIFKPHLDI